MTAVCFHRTLARKFCIYLKMTQSIYSHSSLINVHFCFLFFVQILNPDDRLPHIHLTHSHAQNRNPIHVIFIALVDFWFFVPFLPTFWCLRVPALVHSLKSKKKKKRNVVQFYLWSHTVFWYFYHIKSSVWQEMAWSVSEFVYIHVRLVITTYRSYRWYVNQINRLI